MKFIVTYSIKPEQRSEGTARFLTTGAQPPHGVSMESRWHTADMNRGFVLCESNDAEALAKWSADWADLIVLEIVPVIDDEQAARVLGGGS